jgi:WhiB family redox-sensing transcriptional regulator
VIQLHNDGVKQAAIARQLGISYDAVDGLLRRNKHLRQAARRRRDTTWMADGACVGEDTEWWFYPVGAEDNYQYARQVCQTCPVRAACAAHAMRDPDMMGVWGGLDEKQRAGLRRDARRPAI